MFNSVPKLLEVIASYTAQILMSSPFQFCAYFILLCGQYQQTNIWRKEGKGTVSHFIYPLAPDISTYADSQILLSSWLKKLTDPISE